MLRTGLEIGLFGIWSAVFLLMLMPKGKDYRRAFDCPPYVTWAVAVSCAGIEAYVLFFLLVLEIYIPPLFVGWWYNEGVLMFFFCVCVL